MSAPTVKHVVCARRSVVFLHGQPGAGSDWDDVVSLLPPSLRAVTPDRPGYGDNRGPATTLADNARWLVERLTDHSVLAGHSYGGGVALAAAACAPERVRGLVLIASVGPGCLTPFDTVLAAPIAGPMLSITGLSLLPWLARRYPGHAAHPALRTLTGLRRSHGALWRSFLLEQRELRNGLPQWLDRIAGSSVPTLIIADPADKVVPFATARALHDLLPCSRLAPVERGGHDLPRRVPHIVAAEIGAFVDSLD
ncbi:MULTISPECIES: alpha/beta fold hydrolase [unclassified Nocardia]|uniref:alpha/beta fold hydrolase n=1 Tax=unclassified Nocardia TaxID=2637762 RepID=UPI001CE3C11A|nr:MULTISPECIES: alpha/beta hydrolase [unclassified Nocardia]